jgi:hypothetical protein
MATTVKSRRLRRDGHVSIWARQGMHILQNSDEKFWKTRRREDNMMNLSDVGREDGRSMELHQIRVQWRALVSEVLKFCILLSQDLFSYSAHDYFLFSPLQFAVTLYGLIRR